MLLESWKKTGKPRGARFQNTLGSYDLKDVHNHCKIGAAFPQSVGLEPLRDRS